MVLVSCSPLITQDDGGVDTTQLPLFPYSFKHVKSDRGLNVLLVAGAQTCKRVYDEGEIPHINLNNSVIRIHMQYYRSVSPFNLVKDIVFGYWPIYLYVAL